MLSAAAPLLRRALPAAARASGVAGRPSLLLARSFSASAAARAADEAAAADGFRLKFCTPHETLFNNDEVTMVCLPGEDGDFTIMQEHAPIMAELRAGMVTVFKKDESDAEKEEWFVPGGFAFSHDDNTADVSVPEAVRLDDVDLDAVKSSFAEATAAHAAAAEGSPERALAEIDLNTYQALAAAMGTSL